MLNIGIKEFRRILSNSLTNVNQLSEVERKTDEELLKTDIYKDLGLDSLDFEELIVELNVQFNISVDRSMLAESLFQQESTVENFIKMVNDCSIHCA